MTVRVVVYAEGSGERAGNLTLLPAPGESLSEDHLGPVHVLMRRAPVGARGLPEPAVQFEAPLRLARGGREPRGSDLQHRRTLRQLLRWPRADFRPDLAIVIVDADDELDRARRLEMETQDIGVSRVIAAAVREFESWLIADTDAVRKTLTLELSTTKDPESMSCRAGRTARRTPR
jgi:hypothetical protein